MNEFHDFLDKLTERKISWTFKSTGQLYVTVKYAIRGIRNYTTFTIKGKKVQSGILK